MPGHGLPRRVYASNDGDRDWEFEMNGYRGIGRMGAPPNAGTRRRDYYYREPELVRPGGRGNGSPMQALLQGITDDPNSPTVPVSPYSPRIIRYHEFFGARPLIDREIANICIEETFDSAKVGACGIKSCTICLDEFVDGNAIVRLGCTHVFHVSCLRQWLTTSPTCPYCRQNVRRTGAPNF